MLRPGGALVLIVPHRDGTFDHRRPVTTLEHLREDDIRGVEEDDGTHLAEVAALHDLSRDPGAGSTEAFRARCADNVRHRCVHHHVFDTELAVRVVDAVGLRIALVEAFQPHHVLVLATKPDTGDAVSNGAFLGRTAAWRRESPFRSDGTGGGQA